MNVTASTVYDLTVTVEQLENGTVNAYWSTNQPGHVSVDYDEGDEETLAGLHAWVESHSTGDLAQFVLERGASA